MANAKPFNAAQTLSATLSDLKKSGLDKHVKRLRTVPLTAQELTKQYSGLTKSPAAGYLLHYFDVAGKRISDFFRFRFLEQPKRTGFDAVIAHKLQRYVQPSSAAPRVYFAPFADWRELLDDTSKTLYLT